MTSRIWKASGRGLWPAFVAAAFNPASLFGASDRGIVLDLGNSDKLFQASNGTGAVAPGDPVGHVIDQGPLAKHAIQATAASRPKLCGTPRTLGAELAANGGFDADTSWTKGTGWTISGGSAAKAAGTAAVISQAQSLTVGQAYLVTYDITRTAGSVSFQLAGGTTVSGVSRSATGTYFDIVIAEVGNNTIQMSADAAFAGTVKVLSVKPVASFAARGLQFDGIDDALQTPTVDLSGNSKLTVVLAATYPQESGFRFPVEQGNYLSNVAGSFAAQYSTSPTGLLRGASGSATNAFSGGGATGERRLYLSTFELDLAAGTIAQQIAHRFAAVVQSGTPGGASAGGGNFANAAITIGRAANAIRQWKDQIHRIFIINRTLTATERAQVEAWAMAGMARVAIIGDSTSAFNEPAVGLAYAPSVASLTGGLVVGSASVAAVGDKISNQKTKWQAIADKSALQAVIVSVGLNDCNSYGASKSVAQVTADLQDLVNTIRADMPSGCKVIVAQMTPAKGWLGVGAGTAAASYALWQGVNGNIAGAGANPITGADAIVSSHVVALNDGGDNLQAIYDHNGDGVHPNAAARFIIAQAWRSALEGAGVL